MLWPEPHDLCFKLFTIELFYTFLKGQETPSSISKSCICWFIGFVIHIYITFNFSMCPGWLEASDEKFSFCGARILTEEVYRSFLWKDHIAC